MIKEVYASEETVALAKQKACEMLGAEEENVEFEIIQQPSKKLLGVFGGKPAQVKAVLKESVASKALKILKEILYYMNLSSLEAVIVSEENSICNLKIIGEEVGYVVGRHGETLDALQYIVGLIANDKNKQNESKGIVGICIKHGDGTSGNFDGFVGRVENDGNGRNACDVAARYGCKSFAIYFPRCERRADGQFGLARWRAFVDERVFGGKRRQANFV